MKFNRVRQSVVEQTGSDPNDGAGCGRQPHAHIHVARKRTGLQAAVFGAPREVGEPQASVEERAYRGNIEKNRTQGSRASSAANITMDLLTNPLNRGKPEMATAPTMYRPRTRGILRHSPPSAVSLECPVAYSTLPAPMKSRPL